MTATTTTTSEKEEDGDDRKVIWILRLLFCSYAMAIGTLHPFLSVYYHSLGYDGSLIGVLGSITPLTKFLVGPIWGYFSDKAERPNTVLCTALLFSLIGQVSVHLYNSDYRSMIVVLCFTAICNAPIKPLIDSVAIGQLHDRSQFGTLRLCALIGSGLASSVAGRFLKAPDSTGTTTTSDVLEFNISNSMNNMKIFWRSLSGYNLMFFSYASLHVPVFLAILFLRKSNTANKSRNREIGSDNNGNTNQGPSDQRDDKSTKASIWTVFRQKKCTILFFFLAIGALGVSAGVGESFVYVRFREVGISGHDMGMSRSFSSAAGAVMSWYSFKIRNWIGMERVLIFSLLVSTARFLLYSAMTDAWYGYFGEMIRGMAYGCFWSTSGVYAAQLAPPSLRSTTVSCSQGVRNVHAKDCQFELKILPMLVISRSY